jgi:hypothetical protein
MGPVLAGVLQLLALIAALALAYIPLGTYMARVYSSEKHWRVEKWIYKGIGANPDAEMTWSAYLRGVLAFSAVGVLFLYLLQRLQGVLPGSLGFSPVDPAQSFNTAVSFVTNTNWQSYYGEQTMGHVVQTAGLAVQNFVSAAVGMAVAVALVRGFARSRTGELGNFWSDLVRGTVRILLPGAAIAAGLDAEPRAPYCWLPQEPLHWVSSRSWRTAFCWRWRRAPGCRHGAHSPGWGQRPTEAPLTILEEVDVTITPLIWGSCAGWH